MNQESMEFDPLPSLAEYFIVAGISKADEKGMSWRRNNDRWPNDFIFQRCWKLTRRSTKCHCNIVRFFPSIIWREPAPKGFTIGIEYRTIVYKLKNNFYNIFLNYFYLDLIVVVIHICSLFFRRDWKCVPNEMNHNIIQLVRALIIYNYEL